ncbi:MAG: TIGR00289 family protein [Nitrososphaerota archaeon]
MGYTLRLAALFTGGKDSTYAIYRAVRQGHSVDVLLTVFPATSESYMFHYPNLHITKLQSESMGIPQLTAHTAGVGDDELEALKKLMSQVAGMVEGVLTGAIASNYQRRRIEGIASQLGVVVVSPLWGLDPWSILEGILVEEFDVMVTSVSAMGLGEEWLGRMIDRKAVDDLRRLAAKYGINPVGEGGEMETLVLNCPLFSKRIHILRSKRIWRGDSGYLLIEEAQLI